MYVLLPCLLPVFFFRAFAAFSAPCLFFSMACLLQSAQAENLNVSFLIKETE